jgi:hypothetical protein
MCSYNAFVLSFMFAVVNGRHYVRRRVCSGCFFPSLIFFWDAPGVEYHQPSGIPCLPKWQLDPSRLPQQSSVVYFYSCMHEVRYEALCTDQSDTGSLATPPLIEVRQLHPHCHFTVPATLPKPFLPIRTPYIPRPNSACWTASFSCWESSCSLNQQSEKRARQR